MSKVKESDVVVKELVKRAALVASELENELEDLEFKTADIVEIAKLLQAEDLTEGKPRMDPVTGRWTTKKR